MYREIKESDLANIRDILKEKPTLLVIHATWCGACMRFMPIWKTFSKKIKKNHEYQLVAIEESILSKLTKKDRDYIAGKNLYFPKLTVFKDGKKIKKDTVFTIPELLKIVSEKEKPVVSKGGFNELFANFLKF